MGVESEIAEQVGLADDYIIQRFDSLLRVLLDVEVDSVTKHPKMTFSAQLKCRIGYMFDSRRIKKFKHISGEMWLCDITYRHRTSLIYRYRRWRNCH